jgi:hypothetical protein
MTTSWAGESTVNRINTSRTTGHLTGRLTQLLIRGPAALSGPMARWAVNLLAVAGAALMVWSAVIHLQLWGDGYRDISVIGPLFLAQGIGAIVIAVLVAAFRRLVLLAAGAVTLVATAVGLLLSVYISLFGYTESLAVPDAKPSLVVEFTGAAVLVAAAAILLIAGRARPAAAAGTGTAGQSNPSLADDRM